MTNKLKLPARKTLLTGPSRRSILKGGAAALAATTIFKPAILRAADNVIKIGHVSPRTGPMAGFAEADDYMIGVIRDQVKNGLAINGTTYEVQIITKDSQTDESAYVGSGLRAGARATRSTSSPPAAARSTATRSPTSPS